MKVCFVRVSKMTMNEKYEVHVNIKFLVNLNKTATEIYVMICEAYSNYLLSHIRVFEWHQRFRED